MTPDGSGSGLERSPRWGAPGGRARASGPRGPASAEGALFPRSRTRWLDPTNGTRALAAAAWILVAVGVFRAVAFSIAHGDVLAPYNLQIDAETYDRLAVEVLNAGSLIAIPPNQPPGFIGYLAALYAAFGHAWIVPKLAACALLGATAILVWQIGRRVFGDTEALLAATLVAWSPMLRAYCATIQYELPSAFVLLAAQAVFLLAVRAKAPRDSRMLLMAAGAVSGLAVLMREVLAQAFPLLPLHVLAAGRGGRRHRVVSSLVMVGAFAAVVGMGVWTRSSSDGGLLPLSDKAAVNLAIGMNPRANGTFNLGRSPVGSPSGLAFLTQRPWRAIELAGRKVGYFWGLLRDPWNVPRPSATYLGRATMGVVPLERWLALARGGMLAILYGTAWLLLCRRGCLRDTWWLLATPLAVMVAHVALISSHRFAVPVLPQVYLAASLPLAAVLRTMCESPARLVVALTILAAASVAQLAQWPSVYRLEAEELDGFDVEDVNDPLARNQRARSVAGPGARRPVAMLIDEHLAGGWLVVVSSMRVTPGTERPRSDLPVADVVIRAAGQPDCGATIRVAHLGAAGYSRVPARCRLAADAVTRIAIETRGTVGFRLDRLDVYFGRPGAEFNDPDAGPR